MTMSMASASNQHRGVGGRQSSPCPTSSSRSIHSHVQDVVSGTRERFNDVVSSMQGRQGIEPPPSSSSSSPSPPLGVSLVGLRDGLETIIKVMFAPCVSMDIGGVPREEMPATTAYRVATAPGNLAAGSRGAATSSGTPLTPPWGASIPFEVSASSVLGGSLVHSQQSSLHDIAPGGHAQSSTQQQRQQHRPQQQQSHPSSSGRETRMAESQARLRQLGARHQLAGGFPGESLADRSRPIHPADDAREEVLRRQGVATNDGPELVDFDDGISAISSHTLEEMERRQLAAREKRTGGGGGGRTGVTMRVNPRDFTQVVEEGREWGDIAVQGGGDGEGWRQWGGGTLDLVEEVEEKNSEVVFGDPFYEEEGGTPRRDDVADLRKNADMNRVASNRTNLTMNTTGTDESHEFEELYRRQEAMYWQDKDRVADAERRSRGLTRNHDAARSSCQKMSIEERARRLREISRSRSRSDGTGSSCVSAVSATSSSLASLSSGPHPHDTVPINSSDIFRKSSYNSSSSAGPDGVMRRKIPPKHPRRNSRPFAALEHNEI